MKLQLLILILCICSTQTFYSQEEDGVVSLSIPTRNSLTFNRYTISPTFSFVREQTKFLSIYNKREWSQFEDAPLTYLASYSGRFGENIGAGLGLFQQNYGVLTTFGGVLNFAYNVHIDRDSNLTFGLNLAAYKSGINTANVVTNFEDPALQNVPNNFLFSVNPGINYGLEFLDFGVSVHNLVLYNMQSSTLIQDNPEQSIQAHIMYTGYMDSKGFFDESKFSGLIRSEFQQNQTILSALAMITVPKGIWGQIGYNTLYGVSGGLGVNLTTQIAIEYNFETAFGDLQLFGPSHEFTLAYRFKNDNYYDYSREDEVAGILTGSANKKRYSKRVKPTTTSRASLQEAKAKREANAKRIAEENAQKIAEAKAKTEARQKANAEAKAQLVAEQKAKQEAPAKLKEEQAQRTKLEADEKAKRIAETRAKLAAEQKAKAEADAKAKLVAEQEAKEEAAAQAKLIEEQKAQALVAEQKAKAEADAKAKLVAEQKAREEAEAQAKLIEEQKAQALLAEQKAKAEADAKSKLEAEQKAKEEAAAQAKLIEEQKAQALLAEQKAKAEADAKAKLEAEQKAREEAEAQAKLIEEQKAQALLVEQKAKAEADAKAKLVAEQKAKEEAEAQAKLIEEQKAQALLAEQKAKAEADAKAKLVAEQKAKEEAAAQAKLIEEQEAQALLAEQKAKEDLIANPQDQLSQSMKVLAEQTENSKEAQDNLLKELDAIIAVKDKDLKDLKEENDLSDQGIAVKPRAFKSVTAENNKLSAIKSELDNIITTRSEEIEQLKLLYEKRAKVENTELDEVNLFYKSKIKRLTEEQLKAVETRAKLDSKLETIKVATEFEKRRRIKRAAYDNEEDRYTQDRATLNNIKQTTTLSSKPLKTEDFDFGEDQGNSIKILKNVKNIENGYYLVIAVHSNVEKRNDFVSKVVASGENNVDFFYDVNTSEYYIYQEKFDSIEQANQALKSKDNKPYNAKMSLIKIEN